MRVTIDLERDIIIIPDNFFKKISEDNERLQRYGATPVKGIDRIKKSFEIAMSDTDNRLITHSNAKVSRPKKGLSPEEVSKKLAEESKSQAQKAATEAKESK